MTDPKNIIIGAGISGLSCGWALENGLLIEKDSSIGGLCKTIEFDNFKFDLGGHRLFTKNKSVDKFLRSILAGELLEKQRSSSIYKDKKFITYPLRASVLRSLNPFDAARCLFTYALRKIHSLPERTFQDSTKNNFGDRLFELFFKDYTEKMWGLPCQELSKELAKTRLQFPSLKRMVLHAFSSNNRNAVKLADKILYPKMGIGVISERLSENLDIKLNSKITDLICSDNRIERVVINNSEELNCENLISTMPVTKLIKMINPSKEIREISSRLKYRNVILVFLVLRKKKYCHDHWIYFPEKQIFSRLHEPKNWSEHMAPENETGICIEIFCSDKDPVWNMSNSKIIPQIIRELPFLDESSVTATLLKKVPYAYPIYDLYYKENLTKIHKSLLAYKNLYLLGRSGTFRYINMDTCIDDGLRLGRFLKLKQEKHSQNAEEISFFNKQ